MICIEIFGFFKEEPYSGQLLWEKRIIIHCFTHELPHTVSRGMVGRDEGVNQGEGASLGAYGIKPPQERRSRTARVLESQRLDMVGLCFLQTSLETHARWPVFHFGGLTTCSKMDEYCF